eukprot:COSAG03_NODE_16672_length_395_cov_0.702703_1_plen_72_part_10
MASSCHSDSAAGSHRRRSVQTANQPWNRPWQADQASAASTHRTDSAAVSHRCTVHLPVADTKQDLESSTSAG